MKQLSRLNIVWVLCIAVVAGTAVVASADDRPSSDWGMRTSSEQAAALQDGTHWAFRLKDWSQQYSPASKAERAIISERRGNQGTALWAKSQGLETILGARQKTVSQGPDRICRDPRSGKIIVLESKGEGGRIETTYGYPQDTVENKIKSAEFVLRRYRNLSPVEIEANSLVLVEAAKGNLEVRVIHTTHGSEWPKEEGFSDSSRRSQRLAKRTIKQLLADRPDLRSAGRFSELHTNTLAGLSGGANLGFGIWLMLDTGGPAYDDLVTSLDPKSRSRASMFRLGQSGSCFLSGTSMTTSESSSLAALLITDEARASRFATVSEWSGRAGVIFAVAAEGFVIWQYADGQITGRQCATTTARVGGGFAGSWAGAWAGGGTGAAIGVWFEGVGAAPGALIGTVIGGIAGAFGGLELAGYGADSYFQFKDDEWGRHQRADLIRFLSSYYAAQ